MKPSLEQREAWCREALAFWTRIRDEAASLNSYAENKAKSKELAGMVATQGDWTSHVVKTCRKQDLPQELKRLSERRCKELSESLQAIESEIAAKKEAERTRLESAEGVLNDAPDAELIGKGEITKGCRYIVYRVGGRFIAAVVQEDSGWVASAEFIEKADIKQYVEV